jgi:hypothetical protein
MARLNHEYKVTLSCLSVLDSYNSVHVRSNMALSKWAFIHFDSCTPPSGPHGIGSVDHQISLDIDSSYRRGVYGVRPYLTI